MTGDISRTTFDAKKHYTSVRMQQGRLQLDSDWNEQVDIQNHLSQTQLTDCIGFSGAPQKENSNFQISVTENLLDLTIAPGRMYVDGILCELDQEASYLKQPYYKPDYPPSKDSKQPVSLAEDKYIAYLDVWQRHISAIEDPSLREIALSNIPDTTTRTQTIWQLKLAPDSEWKQPTPPRKPTIVARIDDTSGSNQARAGDQGFGNQLYRVEIHKIEKPEEKSSNQTTPSPLTPSTQADSNPADNNAANQTNIYFKWSRDNASIARAIQSFKVKENLLIISTFGQDESEFFQPGQWIEITDDEHDLQNRPGTFVRLTGSTAGNLLAFDPNTIDGDPITPENFPKHPKIRRWEHNTQSDQALILIPQDENQFLTLELGLSINFNQIKHSDSYQPGDYWLLPVRANQLISEIPWNQKPISTDGIQHHYCALAEVQWNSNSFQKDSVQDRRKQFSTLADLTESLKKLDTKSGTAIPGPLQIGITSPSSPPLGTLHVRGEDLHKLDGTVQLATNRASDTSSIVLKHVTLGKDIQVGDRLVLTATTTQETFATTVTHFNKLSGSIEFTPPIPAEFPASFTASTQRSIARFEDANQQPTLVVTAQGNVGVGTATPTALFEVNGLAQVNDIDIKNTFSARIFSGEELTISKKADIAGPLNVTNTVTTTGQITAPTLNITDNATLHRSTIEQLTVRTAAEVQGSLTVSQHITVGSHIDVGASDASNGRVTVHGDLVADRIHANNSFQLATGPIVHLISSAIDRNQNRNDAIPTEQAVKDYVTDSLIPKADLSYVNTELDKKVDQTSLDTLLQQKADLSYVNTELDKKVDQTSLNTLLQQKADLSYVNTELDKKVDQSNLDTLLQQKADLSYVNTELDKKADLTYVNAELSQKADTDFVTTVLEQKAALNGSSAVAFNASQVFIGNNPAPLNDPSTSLFVRSPGSIESNNVLLGAANQPTLELQSADDQPKPHVGDWITALGETHLISAFNFPDLTTRTPFQQNLDQVPCSHQPPAVRIAASDGQTQLVLHAENSTPDKPGDVLLGVTNGNAKLRIESDVDIAGTITAFNVSSSSSQTLKDSITALSSQEVAALLMGLNPVKFSYKMDASQRTHFGFIAEEVPELIATPDRSAIHPIDIIAVLTKVIKDQQSTISTLATVVNQHQKHIELLTQAVSILQQMKQSPSNPPQ